MLLHPHPWRAARGNGGPSSSDNWTPSDGRAAKATCSQPQGGLGIGLDQPDPGTGQGPVLVGGIREWKEGYAFLSIDHDESHCAMEAGAGEMHGITISSGYINSQPGWAGWRMVLPKE
ncbi:hypothetical protein Stsp01_43830 [Streptomyces sp. NBRC 13847]|nr:hypothetical protein Stsp01_43830 [Streptomyces sp. NBRC 13847]